MYENCIGKKVKKTSGGGNKFEPKPFKSGLKINTIKGVTIDPYSNKLAFTFVEDESCVKCESCVVIYD